jgi:hypothetical protein
VCVCVCVYAWTYLNEVDASGGVCGEEGFEQGAEPRESVLGGDEAVCVCVCVCVCV